jgi:hypothetical protein
VCAASKAVKLGGHFIRYPVDLCLLPISILFGYFHGIIKLYAAMTLHVVCFQLSFFPAPGWANVTERQRTTIGQWVHGLARLVTMAHRLAGPASIVAVNHADVLPLRRLPGEAAKAPTRTTAIA